MKYKKINLFKNPFFLTLFLFGVSIGLRYWLSDFSKSIYVYRDELRYYSIAKSLFAGAGMEIYNQKTNFQKILYSIVMMPAFLFPTKVEQIKAICLINAVVMSSGVFPTYLLAKSILKNNKDVFLVVLLYIISSDLTYTMTFMSEVVYMPLGLWAIYLTYKLFISKNSKETYAISAVLGGLIYILYLNKEISLSLLLAYTLWVGMLALCNIKKQKKPFNNHTLLYSIAILWGVFIFSFFLAKLTIFKGMGNSYNQTSINAINSLYKIRYMIYGFGYYLLSVLVAYFVFPVIYPLVNYKEMESNLKIFFGYLVLLLLIMAAVIAYTITVREDLGSASPRIHLRYICFLTIPFLIVFIEVCKKKVNRFPKLLLLLGIGIIIFGFIYQGATDASSVDQTLLNYISICKSTEGIKVSISCIVLILTFLFGWKKNIFIVLFFLLVAGVNIANNVIAVKQYHDNYEIDAEDLEEVEELRNFIEMNYEDKFLIIGNHLDKAQRLADTYFDLSNVYTSFGKQIFANQSDQGTILKETSIFPLLSQQPYADLTEISYIIMIRGAGFSLEEERCDKIRLTYTKNFELYKMKNKEIIPHINGWYPLLEGAEVTTDISERLFYSQYKLQDGIFRSQDNDSFLVFGPYGILPSGNYDITFYYDYFGKLQSGASLGYADINASNLDLSGYKAEILSGNHEVTLKNITIPDNCYDFEIRMFTTSPDVEALKVTIYKNKAD